MTVSLVLSHRHPGKYALNVLAGALAPLEAQGTVRLSFPREPGALQEAVRGSLAEGLPTVVAWSFYSPSMPECADELRALREALPGGGFLAIAGGVHATAEPEETLRAGFDLVCVGEGEQVLAELLERLSRGEPARDTRGFWRLEAGRVVPNGRGQGVDLDAHAPFPVAHGRFGPIEITRGCIYACRFCQTPFMNKARFRHRSPDGVAGWVRALRQAGKRDVRFISPTSLSYGSADESVNLEAVEALLRKVREAAGPSGRVFFGTFPSEVRPEHVTPEAMALLRRWVDNDNLILGGQSGSARVLESSRRGHDVEAIQRAVRVAREGGFLPNVDFILGLPGETDEDVAATVTLMEQLAEDGARVHGHTFMPLPGTPFRGAPPGDVPPAMRERLEQLASRGGLYGHWKAQIATARALADRRDGRARGGQATFPGAGSAGAGAEE